MAVMRTVHLGGIPREPGLGGNPRTNIGPKRGGTTGRAHPAANAGDILTGTGFLTYLNRVRAHAIAGSDALSVAADTMSQGIRKSSKIPGGIDKLLVSRRIKKGITHMSMLELEIARTATAVAHHYRMAFGDPVSGRRRGALDPHK
jgi:hypothetical protein